MSTERTRASVKLESPQEMILRNSVGQSYDVLFRHGNVDSADRFSTTYRSTVCEPAAAGSTANAQTEKTISRLKSIDREKHQVSSPTSTYRIANSRAASDVGAGSTLRKLQGVDPSAVALPTAGKRTNFSQSYLPGLRN